MLQALLVRCLATLTAVLAFSSCERTDARGDAAVVEAALERPVLDPAAAQDDLARFIGARLPHWTPPSDAQAWIDEAARMRAQAKATLLRGAAASWAEAELQTHEVGPLVVTENYVIIGLLFEAIPDLWVPAWLYVPRHVGPGPFPAIINFNGHERAGALAPDKQARLINQVKRGFVAMNVEWLGVGQLRRTGLLHDRIGQLDLVGTSGVAPFYLLARRALDVLTARAEVDAARVGVTGLSGGGWQAILLAALDERVAAANPVAGHAAMETRLVVPRDFGDPEQLPADMLAIAEYKQLTAMVAPRPLLLTYNAKDAAFRSDRAVAPLVEVAVSAYDLFDAGDRWAVHVNHVPGNHNFLEDNRLAHYLFVERALSPAAPARGELHTRAEILAPARLRLDVPDDVDFTRIAANIAEAQPPAPRDVGAALRAVTRARLDTTIVTRERWRRGHARGLELETSDGWHLPATQWESSGTSDVTVILLDDRGRAATADAARRSAATGARTLAVDLLHTGELSLKQDAMWTLAIQAVGERSVGIAIGALIAIANNEGDRRVRVEARGPISSFVAIGAAVLAPSIDEVAVEDSLRSLSQLISRDVSVNDLSELFCFGLLLELDVAHLKRALGARLVAAHHALPMRGKKARG